MKPKKSTDRNGDKRTPTRAELLRKGIDVVVGIPMPDAIFPAAFLAFWQIAERGWPVLHRPDTNSIEVNRNALVEMFLRTKHTHLVMLDADHVHPPDVVERLAQWALRDRSRWIIGSLQFLKHEPFNPTVYDVDSSGRLIPIEAWTGSLEEHVATGMAATLFDRRVFTTLPWPWFQVAYWPKERSALGEDIYFCAQAHQHGLRIWVDTGLTSPHIAFDYVQSDAYNIYKLMHPRSPVRGHAPVPGSIGKPT